MSQELTIKFDIDKKNLQLFMYFFLIILIQQENSFIAYSYLFDLGHNQCKEQFSSATDHHGLSDLSVDALSDDLALLDLEHALSKL